MGITSTPSFDALTTIANPLNTVGGSTLTIKTKTTTDARTYVAEADGKKYPASIEFVVDQKEIATTKFDVATKAPADGDNVAALGNATVTPDDGLTLSVKWYKGDTQCAQTTEIKDSENFANTKFATAVITLTVDGNHKLKNDFTVTLGGGAEKIKSTNYDIKKGANLNEWIISSKVALS